MARFLAGEGSRAQPSPAGRGGPARPGPAPHAAARSRGSLRGWHRGRGGGSAPLPAAALKGAERRRARVGRDPRSQVSAIGVAPTAATAAFPASLPLQRGTTQSRPVPLGCSRWGSAALIPRGCASLCPPGDRAGCNLARWARSSGRAVGPRRVLLLSGRVPSGRGAAHVCVRGAGLCLLSGAAQAMIQRHQLVQSVLQELQEATECFGLEGLASAALEAERTLSSFSLPGYCRRQFQEELEVDRVARSLYPEDAPSNMLPLVCKGEGNRLFEAASVLLWGNPSLSLELQVRTVVEMLLHKQYYLNGMIDSKVMLQAARYSLCTEETPEMTSLPMAILEAIFDADIKATCFPGTFANMWHVYALASVLQCNIYSIYPMSNLKIRPYFNRLIRPRKCGPQTSTLHIMWSGQQLSRQVFKAQYFVAVVGLEELEPTIPSSEPPVQPMRTLELLNSDPQLTYSNLRDRYSITKSTFYRWKRQSREHRQKAAARFAAKHFLQSCFQEGNIVSLQHFRQMFPEISRSTYYAWKHEMQSMVNGDASDLTEAHGLQELHREVPKKADVNEPTKAEASLRPPSPSVDPVQAGIFMRGAKSYLEKCISMNTLVPYRCFKHSFPGISRSTYYNWRRKAIKENPNFKPPQPPLNNQKPLAIEKPLLQLKPSSLPARKKLNGDQPAARSLLQLKPSLCWRKRLRDVARRQVQQWRLPFSKFCLRYPTLSSTTYWFWKGSSRASRQHRLRSSNRPLNRITSLAPQRSEPSVKPPLHMEAAKHLDKSAPATPYNATISGYPVSERANSQMFVMDVIATTQFKAQAKLFLQQRFESKTFPTYKEFSARFPLTARSTYYMWKRALHDGLTLVDV